MHRLTQRCIAIHRDPESRKAVTKIDRASTGMHIANNNLPKAAVAGRS